MIYTSYFAKLKELEKNNIIPVSICGKAPNWYKGLQYKKLAPKYDFFIEWKRNHNNEYYIKYYQNEILNKLNIVNVLTELQILLPDKIKQKMESPFYNNLNYHIALICYEKPSNFCHRYLVAKWLNQNNYYCKEWEDD